MEINITAAAADHFLWETLLNLIIAASAGGLAMYGYIGHKNNARRRATIDLIEKNESSGYYQELHATFKRYRTKGELHRLHAPADQSDIADRQRVLDYLNHYELVSIGILNEILDAKIYKSWMGGPFVRDWIAAEKFIVRERWKKTEDGKVEYYDRLYANFNIIACRWDDGVEILSEGDSPPPVSLGGPGDEPIPKINLNGNDGDC